MHGGAHGGDPAAFGTDVGDLRLLHPQALLLFQGVLHDLLVSPPVGLGPEGPHRRALAPVEHPVLDAGLVGGLGIAPGANIGKDYAVFEAVHGSAPDIAGQNKANPTAEIMSAAMMLDHLGELEIAERIRRGVRAVYADGSVLTGDIRKATGSSAPAASCTEFTEALIAAIKAQA